MEEPEHSQHEPGPGPSSSSATTSTDGQSSSSASISQVQEEEVVENERQENGDSYHPHHHRLHHHHHHHHHFLLNRQQHRPSIVSYRMNTSIPDAASPEMRDDVWSCLVVLVTFWFFGQFHPHLHFLSSSSSSSFLKKIKDKNYQCYYLFSLSKSWTNGEMKGK